MNHFSVLPSLKFLYCVCFYASVCLCVCTCVYLCLDNTDLARKLHSIPNALPFLKFWVSHYKL